MYKHSFNLIALATIYLVVGVSAQTPPQISIIESNLPSIEYELHAVQSYVQAWFLHGTEKDKLLEAYVELYEDVHPTPDGWKVAVGCANYYNPSPELYIRLNITDGKNWEALRLFSFINVSPPTTTPPPFSVSPVK